MKDWKPSVCLNASLNVHNNGTKERVQGDIVIAIPTFEEIIIFPWLLLYFLF